MWINQAAACTVPAYSPIPPDHPAHFHNPAHGFITRAQPAAPHVTKVYKYATLLLTMQLPLHNPTITQRFGENPANYARFNQPGHEGLDFSCTDQDPVFPIAPGSIYAIETNPNAHPYGLHIRIQHAANELIPFPFKSIYAHLSKINTAPGELVDTSTIIAFPGNTGNSTGIHLHLTLKIEGQQTPGYPPQVVDPYPYLYLYANPLTPAPTGYVIVTAHTLYIRRSPSTTAPIVGVIHNGQTIPINFLVGATIWANIAPAQFIALRFNDNPLAQLTPPPT